MANVAPAEPVPTHLDLDVEYDVLAGGDRTVVQSAWLASALLRETIHGGPGTIAGQRDLVSPQDQHHSDHVLEVG